MNTDAAFSQFRNAAAVAEAAPVLPAAAVAAAATAVAVAAIAFAAATTTSAATAPDAVIALVFSNWRKFTITLEPFTTQKIYLHQN